VLERENCCRDKDGDLAAVVDRLEGSAQRYFGLAETNVANNQAIHRSRRFHAATNRVDRRKLIARFCVRE